MILRLPQKLNDRMKGGPLDVLQPHQNPLLDWSVRSFAVAAAEQLLLCNTLSLYWVVLDHVSGEDATRFSERVFGVVGSILEGVGCGAVGRGVEPVRFAKPLDRSVIGSMNELVAHATALMDDRNVSVQEAGLRLNEVLLSVLRRGDQKYGRPRAAFAELVAGAGS